MDTAARDADVITAIVASPRAQGRFDVVVNGQRLATLSLEVIERLALRVGLPVATLREAIEHEAAALHTYDRALSLLAARSRSARELEVSLIRKGEEPANVRNAILRLSDAGIVDDASYARQFARSKILGAGHSARRLRRQLASKGVAREIADDAVGEVIADENVDETKLILAAARKKLRTLGGLDPETRRRRLFAFLARRGFEMTAIRSVCEGLRDEVNAPGGQ